MYCCCGVKKNDGWKCECDWNGWFKCYDDEDKNLHALPYPIPIKKIPDKDGIYEVRVFGDGDDHETKSEFSTVEKNWDQPTNKAISHWEITYDDNWMGYVGVYAWKEMT